MALVLVGMLLLCLVVMLPFAVSSAFVDVNQQTGITYRYAAPELDDGGVVSSLNLEVTAISEFDGMATIRVSVDRSCLLACEWGDRYLLASLAFDKGEQTQSRPASAAVNLPREALGVTQLVMMPVLGDPVRYPFDRYRLMLGITAQRIAPDGSIRTLSTAEARASVETSFTDRAPRIKMNPPGAVNVAEAIGARNAEQLPIFFAQEATFRRPLYTLVLTVLLILLVTAAAAYAVFLRPLDQLIINSGALVLGVWGIRSILLGVALPGITLVDLSLSLVILFLLAAITVRTLWLLDDQSGIMVLHGRRTLAEEKRDAPAPRGPDFVPPSAVRAGDGRSGVVGEMRDM